MRRLCTTFWILVSMTLASCGGSSSESTESNELTLEDGTGLSEIVLSSIEERYPENQVVKDSLTQLASGIQGALATTIDTSSEELNRVFEDVVDATDCITAVSPRPHDDLIFVEALMVNNEAKSRAYDEFNQKASGQFFGGTVNFEEGCR